MRQFVDSVDPGLPPAVLEAVRYRLAMTQILQLTDTLDAHAVKLGKETERSVGAATVISDCCGEIRGLIQAHLVALVERKAEQAELQDLLVEQTTVLRTLELRLPDPKQVRHEILSDLWLAYQGRVLDNAKEIEVVLDVAVREAAAKFIEYSSLGCLAPAPLPDGSSLRDRMLYLRASIRFRIRKFAADWLHATVLVGVALLALLVAALAFHKPLYW